MFAKATNSSANLFQVNSIYSFADTGQKMTCPYLQQPQFVNKFKAGIGTNLSDPGTLQPQLNSSPS